MSTHTLRAFGLVPVLTALLACGPEMDAGDTQNVDQSEDRPDTPTPSAKKAVIEGQVESEAAVEVRSVLMGDSGETVEDSRSEVEADGSFSVEITASGESESSDLAFVQALNAEGEVIGQIFVQSVPESEGERGSVAPIDSETTTEAEIYLALVQSFGDADEVSYGRVRAEVNAFIGAAIQGAEDSEEQAADFAAALEAALRAEAMLLAERTGEAAAETSEEARAEAEAQASLTLEATLSAIAEAEAAGESTREEAEEARAEAEAAFMAEIQAALESTLEGSEEARAETASELSAVAGLALISSLEAMGSEDSAMFAETVLLHGETQAALTVDAIASELDSESWSDAQAAAELDAALELLLERSEEAAESGDLDAMAEAWAELQLALMATGDGEDALEVLLDLSLVAELAYEDASERVYDASAELEASVEAAAESFASDGEAEAMAALTVDAWLQFEDRSADASFDLMAELESALSLDDGGEFFTTLFVQSAGSFVYSY